MSRRRGNDLQPAGMRRGRRAQQVAVDPRPGLDQVGERQAGPQAKLEGGVAELHVEVDQARFAAALRFAAPANRIASCVSSAVAPTPPTLLMTLTSLADAPPRCSPCSRRACRGSARAMLRARRCRAAAAPRRARRRGSASGRRPAAGRRRRRSAASALAAASFWNRSTEALLSAETWTTAAAAALISAGSIARRARPATAPAGTPRRAH